MPPSTRRAALGAILTAPLASVPVVAATQTLPDDEAPFLAIGPQFVKLLDEYDRLWAPVHAAYEVLQDASEHLPYPRWPAREALPEWSAYIAFRRPTDALNEIIDALYEPFKDLHLTSLGAVLLRCRYAATFEADQNSAFADIVRLWDEGTLCA